MFGASKPFAPAAFPQFSHGEFAQPSAVYEAWAAMVGDAWELRFLRLPWVVPWIKGAPKKSKIFHRRSLIPASFPPFQPSFLPICAYLKESPVSDGEDFVTNTNGRRQWKCDRVSDYFHFCIASIEIISNLDVKFLYILIWKYLHTSSWVSKHSSWRVYLYSLRWPKASLIATAKI